MNVKPSLLVISAIINLLKPLVDASFDDSDYFIAKPYRQQQQFTSGMNDYDDRPDFPLISSIFRDYTATMPRHYGIENEPILVVLQPVLYEIIDINEVEQSLTLNVDVMMNWTDFRLAWNLSTFENITYIEVPPERSIWIPDLTWDERKESRPQWRRDAGILLHYDGHIYLTAQSIIKASCAIDVRCAIRCQLPPPSASEVMY